MPFSSTAKPALLTQCRHFAQQRIDTANEALDMVSEATSDNSKSTAGDKHETSRAMAHIEQERNAIQLAEAQKLMRVLAQIDPEKPHLTIALGSLVRTETGIFFLAIPAGQLLLDAEKVMAISPGSPVGTAMLGKRAGDSYSFRDRQFRIVEVI